MQNKTHPKPCRDNQAYEWTGQQLKLSYVSLRKLEPIEAAQDYTITDAIAALLHHARAAGFDPATILLAALNHYEAETTVCPDCNVMQSPDEHECREGV